MRPYVTHMRFVARCLTPFFTQRDCSELHRIICSGSVSWETAAAIASDHLVAPALFSALTEKKIIEWIPPDFADYLRLMSEVNHQRNVTLKSRAIGLIDTFNAHGIEPLLLKGAAWLFNQPDERLGERIFADLDILVPRDAAQLSAEILYAQGYEHGPEDPWEYENCQHLPPFIHPGFSAPVEIHTTLGAEFEPAIVDSDTAWAHSLEKRAGDTKFRVLSVEDQVKFLIFHSEIHHEQYFEYTLRLRPLLDLAHTLIGNGLDVDWERIQASFGRWGYENVLVAYCARARRLMSLPLPIGKWGVWSEGLHYYEWEDLPRPVRAFLTLSKLFTERNMGRRFKLPRNQNNLMRLRARYIRNLLTKYLVGSKNRKLGSLLVSRGTERSNIIKQFFGSSSDGPKGNGS